ncbi:RND transporter [Methylocella tundrae]|uniref:RND transporter n=1 Tax=Methylocella tundrae TaxID=227605 RepID=A0A8B6M9F2_METTU|nr:efflux transporter outer membrane subunit [Methylocella tundrae]VTZ51627.1 RND transporter [Methylocella tundrae]
MAEKSSMLAAALALVSMCGCVSVGPDFEPPDPMLPSASFLGKSEPAALAPARGNFPPPDPKWWTSFHDPILASLAERVAAANLDVQTATLRLAESRFQRGVAASAELPSISGNASYQRELYSQNGIFSLAKSFLSPGTPFFIPPISVWQTTLDASWELDIWGRVRRQVEAADAQIQVSEAQRRDTLVSTLAELARDYIELRGIQAQIAISNANLARSSEILQLTKTLATEGLGSDLDVVNASGQVEAVRASLPPLKDQETARINALSLLLDEPPGSLRGEMAQTKPIPPTPPRAPLGVPSELALRRPDIRRAEAQLHAATASIGVAVGDFYPSVKLNGSAGFDTLDLRTLWKGSSLQYALGPSVSLPIFEGGRLKSTLELREAQQQEAAIAYHKTVLQAWHEVVDALVAYRTEQERRASLKAQVDRARQGLALSRTRYHNGLADFISVLDAERTALQAELQFAQSTTTVSTDLVQLYKALGGGWELAFPEESATSVATLQPTP